MATAAAGFGGAIFVNAGTININSGAFTDNGVLGGGGASTGNAVARDIYNWDGIVVINGVSYSAGGNNTCNILPADSSKSTIISGTSSIPADEASSATITVTLKNVNGDTLLPGKKVSLNQTGGSSVITPVNNGIIGDNGSAAFTVTDTHGETVTYSAVDVTDNVPLLQTVQVKFMKYLQGDGTESSPYVVSSADELNFVRDYP